MLVQGMPNHTEPKAVVSASTDASDAELVSRACAADAAAFDALVRRHYRTAYSVALATTRRRADAEDVCHDAFVRAAEHLETCRQPERFAQWLCSIVRNRARNAVARSFGRRTTPLEHATAASTANPVRDAELAELRDRLTRALNGLSQVQREVVLLHDLAGHSHDEIAEVIGTSAGMSRQHLFKARQKLRASLDDLRSTESDDG